MPKTYAEPLYDDREPSRVPVYLSWPDVEVSVADHLGPQGEPVLKFMLPIRQMNVREALRHLGIDPDEPATPDMDRLADAIAEAVHEYDMRRLFASATRHHR